MAAAPVATPCSGLGGYDDDDAVALHNMIRPVFYTEAGDEELCGSSSSCEKEERKLLGDGHWQDWHSSQPRSFSETPFCPNDVSLRTWGTLLFLHA